MSSSTAVAFTTVPSSVAGPLANLAPPSSYYYAGPTLLPAAYTYLVAQPTYSMAQPNLPAPIVHPTVPRPPDTNIVRCMWLFRHKYLADGTLSRYKARLVANGSTQMEGVDVDETLSPVVKPGSIRTVLSLVASRHWPIHHLDVKNAFLYGDLSATVYMHQPLGFRDYAHPDYVCLLQRSLYGLKQASRAWFQRFASYITRAGFSHCRCDSSLFIYRQGIDTAYLLLYMDDIVLTASSKGLLQRIIGSLHEEFAMTDLGPLNYFLGISGTRNSLGLFLSQKKYVIEILKKARMVSCNYSRTPVDSESKVGVDGDIVSDPTLCRSLVGSLQDLTFTRSDISYAVQQVCLYMHDPREPHLSALKRHLRYIQGTLSYGLQLFSSSNTDLVAYSDANWAGCPTTRRSTLGYCVFFDNNLLSWFAKRQLMLSPSSAEAEYRGVANVVAKTCCLRNLLRELHTPLSSATLVYYDNVSAVYLSSNPVQHQRTKHIKIDIHFVRDLVAAGQIRTEIREEFRTSSGPSDTGGNPPPVTIHTWLERFNKQKPYSFEKATAPVDAENWISHMEKIFDVMGCEDAFKIRSAVYKFEGNALAWWKAYNPWVPLRATPTQFALLVDVDTQESVVKLVILATCFSLANWVRVFLKEFVVGGTFNGRRSLLSLIGLLGSVLFVCRLSLKPCWRVFSTLLGGMSGPFRIVFVTVVTLGVVLAIALIFLRVIPSVGFHGWCQLVDTEVRPGLV
nr:ribonuclease H-like domain-containing protein [Tanacetum cinerariifolium]